MDGLVIADTREQVATLNATIRDGRMANSEERGADGGEQPTTRRGERIGIGDRIATRRNNRDLDVANRDTWTVTAVGTSGGLVVAGRGGERTLPAAYVRDHVELAYATTVYGAQGGTVDAAHFLLGETTGAAAAYVAMTRGRKGNTAHLVAGSVADARAHWIEVFARDRADLGAPLTPPESLPMTSTATGHRRDGRGHRAAWPPCRRRRSTDPDRGVQTSRSPGRLKPRVQVSASERSREFLVTK